MTYSERNSLLTSVAAKHGMTPDGILGRSRFRKDVLARRECAQVLRKSGLSLPVIGRFLNRHHTSILALLSGRWDRTARYLLPEGTA